jgi:serine/threonine-protein kinase
VSSIDDLPELGERYEVGTVLGRGGMGEVRLARDLRIEREVAVKLMRSSQRDRAALARFFREARVQGMLEHPAVVPIHDLGLDPAGNPCFVMKRLAGTTLAAVLGSTDPAIRARWPRRQLLNRFVDVCLAIEFAHTRGVVHRDLKPSNIMFGDFGEAYVLDWGLARITSDRPDPPSQPPVADDGGHTAAGELLGTPGYMSPEQARGDQADARSDVFALGCVLFEILAGVPALPHGKAGIAAALATSHHRPSRCALDVPPELDDLCARATAANAADRPSARVLADKLQEFLDGDHDLARRRELAAELVASATTALAAGDTEEARARATREAARALALDPESQRAQEVLAGLLVPAPKQIPAEALAEADLERARTRQAVFRIASHGYLILVAIAFGLLLLPLHRVWPVLVTASVSLGSWIIARRLSRQVVHGRSAWYLALLVSSACQLAMAGLLFGPLLVMPILMVGSIAAFLSQPSEFHARVSVVALTAPLVVLLGLELAGVLPRSIDFSGPAVLLRSWVIDFTPFTTAVIYGLAIATQLAITVALSIRTMRAQREAQNAVHAQTWHLQQLVPRGGSDVPAPSRDALEARLEAVVWRG